MTSGQLTTDVSATARGIAHAGVCSDAYPDGGSHPDAYRSGDECDPTPVSTATPTPTATRDADHHAWSHRIGLTRNDTDA